MSSKKINKSAEEALLRRVNEDSKGMKQVREVWKEGREVERQVGVAKRLNKIELDGLEKKKPLATMSEKNGGNEEAGRRMEIQMKSVMRR